MSNVKRPLVRYHGGKWTIAPWILSFMPSQKDKLYLTPYSRDEYLVSFQRADDPLEQARRTIIRSFFGFGTVAILCEEGEAHPGFKSNIKRAGTSPGPTWRGYPEALTAIIERMRGVVIENRNAFELVPVHDSQHTVFYADPPYLPQVRDSGEDYRYEMTERDHIILAERLNDTAGAVLVSGYRSELYDELYKGWIRREKKTRANGHGERTEVLWMKGVDLGLFKEGNDV